MHFSMKFPAITSLVLGLLCGATRAESVEDAIDGYLAVAGSDLFAQATPKKTPWDIKGNIGLNYREGNTNILNFAMLLDARRKFGEDHLLSFVFQGLYTEDTNVETGSEWIMVQRWEHSINEKSRLWQQLWLETDSQESLALRWVLTAGYGYRLAKTDDDKFVMWGEVGGGYRSDNFYGGDTNNEAILQINFDWVWKISKTLTYEQIIQFWPSLSNGGEFLFVWNSKFILPISDRWNFELIVQDKYNSQPVAGTVENDFAILLTLSFDFTKSDKKS